MVYYTLASDELYHYGVIGMKWGVRKDRYASRPTTRAVRRRSKEDLDNIKAIQRYDNVQHMRILNGRNFVANSKVMQYKLSRIGSEIQNSLPLKKRNFTKDEDLAVINPGGKSTTVSGSNNCLLCTVAYDMRRRGYNVIANQRAPIEYLYDIGDEDLSYMYPKAKKYKAETLSDITSKVVKQGNGSRGALLCTWKGSKSGHVVAYEVENNQMVLYDAQDGTKYTNPNDLFKDAHNFMAVQTNLSEPDYKYVQLAIE